MAKITISLSIEDSILKEFDIMSSKNVAYSTRSNHVVALMLREIAKENKKKG